MHDISSFNHQSSLRRNNGDSQRRLRRIGTEISHRLGVFSPRPAQLLLACVLSLLTLCPSPAYAQSIDGEQTLAVAKRIAARKMDREAVKVRRAKLNAPKSSSQGFSGFWHGRMVLERDSCRTGILSFGFRHVLYQQGGAASLSTSHDGVFSGRSRSKGRKIEFVKSAGYGCYVAVIYGNLSRDKRVAQAAYGVGCQNGCMTILTANAIRAR